MSDFDAVLSGISDADSLELSEIAQAVMKRYAALFPEYEVAFLSLPRNDPEKRFEILRRICDLEERYR